MFAEHRRTTHPRRARGILARKPGRALHWVLVLCLVLLALGAQAPWASEKKGVAFGIRTEDSGHALASLQVGWYYNWTLKPSFPSSAHCFVPMFWGKRGQLEALNRLAPQPLPYLLTYNEPDFPNQSNRTIDEVVQEWPQLAQYAVRISAPAAGRPFERWMRQFMTQAESLGLKVDFVPVHWYGGPDSKRFLEFIDKLHALYKLPLWITEFAVADWHSTKYGSANRFSEDDVVRFIDEVLPELEKRAYVERYAWLASTSPKESLRPSQLFTPTGQLTKVGRAYARFVVRSTAHEARQQAFCGM